MKSSSIIILIIVVVFVLGAVGVWVVFQIAGEAIKEDARVVPEYEIPQFKPGQTEFTDEEILAATYSDYKRPEGYSEEKWVNFLKRECADDINEAREWAESGGYTTFEGYKGLINERENEKYFEWEVGGYTKSESRHAYLIQGFINAVI